MKITFSSDAWAEYVEWQNQDKKTLKRINLLIQDIGRSPCKGIGQPEPLKGEYAGFWSRRIDHYHRLV
ncbi:MAG: Txe/YoeB family addiction module toxin [Gammaproteobacteria bacterium]|nr:MAG: Txe/YoeB family addiction module toxin [Gammaproteobacteria bacterium]